MRRILLLLAVFLFSMTGLSAQTSPSEGRAALARRLVDLEETWLRISSPEARRRALPSVEKAVQAFFSFRLNEAARLLDEARLLLLHESPPAAKVWAASWRLSLGRSLIPTEKSPPTIECRLDRLYAPNAAGPEGAQLFFEYEGLSEETFSYDLIGDAKASVRFDFFLAGGLGEGDHPLTVRFLDGEQETLRTLRLAVSRVKRLSERLDRLEETEFKSDTIRGATIRHRLGLLRALVSGKPLETECLGARLLKRTEALARTKGPPGVGPGEHRFALPLGEGGSLPIRLMVPDAERPPLVVALHGAGGSENMFFEAYGAGRLVDLCRQRGWALVSPGLGLAPTHLPVQTLLDGVAQLTDYDASRVFILGHSMGAMTTVGAVQDHPDRFRACALISGGGRIRDRKLVADLPLFLAAGERDFGKKGILSLARFLDREEEVRIYPDTEHLLVVGEALSDIIRFFAKHAPRRKAF